MLSAIEIANIKRIDTSLNVFRKKIKALEVKKDKLIAPILEEQMNLKAEIDFWERPVIDRYGKTTEELLREEGETTAREESDNDEAEKLEDPFPNNNTTADTSSAKTLSSDEPVDDCNSEQETQEDEFSEISQDASSFDAEFPKEWND